MKLDIDLRETSIVKRNMTNEFRPQGGTFPARNPDDGHIDARVKERQYDTEVTELKKHTERKLRLLVIAAKQGLCDVLAVCTT